MEYILIDTRMRNVEKNTLKYMSLIINWWNIVVLALGLIATFWCNNKYNETKSRKYL